MPDAVPPLTRTPGAISDAAGPARRSSGPNTAYILIGFGLGAIAGVASKLVWGGGTALDEFVKYVVGPVGEIWLRSLIMIVIPLVFAVLSLGVAELGNVKKLGRIGAKTFFFFVVLAALSGALGLLLVNTFRPGAGLSAETSRQLLDTYRSQASPAKGGMTSVSPGIQTLINIVPRNPIASAARGDMLPVIFFSLIFGVALGRLPAERNGSIRRGLRALAEVMAEIIDLVMKLAPFGVFALIFTVAARFGFDLLARVGWYALCVIAGLIIFQLGVFPLLLRWVARRDPWDFLGQARVVMLTAFSTASSIGTLPTTLRVSETTLGLPKEVGGFVLPLGASMNKIGSALFESASIAFIAQVLGIPLGWSAQVVVVAMTVLTAGVSNAGIPSAVVPLMIPVLDAVGVPGEGIALIIGMDRLLDMCRTVVNVTGHMVIAACVARSEGRPNHDQ
ncbi:MAG TPA: dicarboxylate/amino acid:cation symporter [Terriglobia bacterium]|nr:dicarboxylate/amino acid:cation symporter [Terriglobia bacterium]